MSCKYNLYNTGVNSNWESSGLATIFGSKNYLAYFDIHVSTPSLFIINKLRICWLSKENICDFLLYIVDSYGSHKNHNFTLLCSGCN